MSKQGKTSFVIINNKYLNHCLVTSNLVSNIWSFMYDAYSSSCKRQNHVQVGCSVLLQVFASESGVIEALLRDHSFQ